MFEEAAAVVVVVVETVGAAAAAEVVAVAAVESAAAGALAVPATAEIEIVEVLEVVVGAGAVAAAVATSAAEPPRRPPPAGRRRPTSHSCRALELACGQQRWQREQQLKVRTAVMIKLSMMTENVDEGQLPEQLMQQSPQVFELCRASAATPSPPPQFAVAPARWRCPAD